MAVELKNTRRDKGRDGEGRVRVEILQEKNRWYILMGLITLGIDPNQIQGQLAQCNLSVALETEYALAVET